MSSSLPQRQHLRHDGYDYRKSGAYFVTICIEDRLPLLGRTDRGAITLTGAGNMISDVWQELPDTFPSTKLDTFVVMPNHLHFVIWLTESLPPQETVSGDDPDSEMGVKHRKPSLPEVMQWFKSLTTAKYRRGVRELGWPVFPGRLWQRSYYEHIVRSDAVLYAIRRYIQENPLRWHLDRYHPNPVGADEQAIALWKLLQKEDSPS